jgi:hypothetical protein
MSMSTNAFAFRGIFRNNIREYGFRFPYVLSLVLAGLGCGGTPDGVANKEPVAETQAAYSGYWTYGWGTDGTNNPYSDSLLSANDATCFLTGVTGNLQPNSVPIDNLAGSYYAFAGMYLDFNGYWRIGAYGGGPVSASGICVPSHAVANSFTYDSNTFTEQEALFLLTDNNPNTRCFLSEVIGQPGYWNVYNSAAQVYFDDNQGLWAAQGFGQVKFTVNCIHAENNFSWQTNWSAGSGQAVLALWQGPSTGTSPLGTQCALQGLGGEFSGASNDGVLIDGDSTMTVSPFKTGWSNCFQ